MMIRLLLPCLLLALSACELLSPGVGGEPSGRVYFFDPADRSPERFPSDYYQLMDAAVAGDTLLLRAGVSGCEPVIADLAVSSVWAESLPPQTGAWLDFRPQACDAIFEQTFRFDLSPVRVSYQQGYQTTTGAVVIHFAAGRPDALSVLYEF